MPTTVLGTVGSTVRERRRRGLCLKTIHSEPLACQRDTQSHGPVPAQTVSQSKFIYLLGAQHPRLWSGEAHSSLPPSPENRTEPWGRQRRQWRAGTMGTGKPHWHMWENDDATETDDGEDDDCGDKEAGEDGKWDENNKDSIWPFIMIHSVTEHIHVGSWLCLGHHSSIMETAINKTS